MAIARIPQPFHLVQTPDLCLFGSSQHVAMMPVITRRGVNIRPARVGHFTTGHDSCVAGVLSDGGADVVPRRERTAPRAGRNRSRQAGDPSA
jgi:hypothetical protein